VAAVIFEFLQAPTQQLRIARLQTTDELTSACGETPGVVCRATLDATGNQTAATIADVLATRGLRIALILISAWLVRRMLRKHSPRITSAVIARHDAESAAISEADGYELSAAGRVERDLRRERARQRANTLGGVISSVLSGVIAFAAGLMILDQFGVNLAPLIAGAGVIGIALGFGAQQIVKDFLAGIFIIFEDQYGVGDSIDIGHASGVVERLGLRVTQLRDVNGTVWFVSNGEIKRIGNQSQLWAKAVLDIEVGYETDVALAESLMLDAATSLHDEALPDLTIISTPEFWGIDAFGINGVTLRLVVRTEANEQWAVARELRGRIKTAFDENGIAISFTQRTVEHKNVENLAG